MTTATMEMLRQTLLWCAVMNFGLLFLWFGFLTLAHDLAYRAHGSLFRLSRENFDTMHYAGMGLFKLGILLFNLVPYLALRIIQ